MKIKFLSIPLLVTLLVACSKDEVMRPHNEPIMPNAEIAVDKIGLSIDFSGSYKETKVVTSTISYTDEDDDLGTAVLYFVDPFFLERTGVDEENFRAVVPYYEDMYDWGGDFKLKNISTGSVAMSFLPLRNK